MTRKKEAEDRTYALEKLGKRTNEVEQAVAIGGLIIGSVALLVSKKKEKK